MPTVEEMYNEVNDPVDWMADKWRAFFMNYHPLNKGDVNDTGGYYFNKITGEMFGTNSKTLVLDYEDVVDAIQNGLGGAEEQEEFQGKITPDELKIIEWRLREDPDQTSRALRQAVYKVMKDTHFDYSQEIKDDFKARFKNFPVSIEITDITHKHIGKLVTLEGIVPELDPMPHTIHITTTYRCGESHNTMVDGRERPRRCNMPDCKNTNFTIVNEVNDTYQEVRFQQRPDKTKEGRMVSEIKVAFIGTDITGDNMIPPGSYIKLTGIVRLKGDITPNYRNRRGTQDISDFFIEASYVEEETDNPYGHDKTEYERNKELMYVDEKVKGAVRVGTEHEAEDFEILWRSISSTTSGHEIVKKAGLLQMAGSDRVVFDDGTVHRGDITMLLAGAPASAKSIISNYLIKMYTRPVKPTGEGLSKAGLTASVDLRGEQPTLKAGACVMANGDGIVCIEEMQSLKDEVLRALLETMEDNQSVTVTKFGIYRTLNARAPHIHIMNPKRNSHWDDDITLMENTGFRPELLSRYDAIFVFRDIADKAMDETKFDHWFSAFAKGVTETGNKEIDAIAKKKKLAQTKPAIVKEKRQLTEHEKSVEYFRPRLHSMQFMQRWRRYVRREIHPSIAEDSEPVMLLKRFYIEMRDADSRLFSNTIVPTQKEESIKKKIPMITMRQIGALIRWTMASARAHMRDNVTVEDAKTAIEIVHYSIINSGYNPATSTAHIVTSLLNATGPKVTELDIARFAQRLKDRFYKEANRKYRIFHSTLKKMLIYKCGICHGTGFIQSGSEQFNCTTCKGFGCSLNDIEVDDLFNNLRLRQFMRDDMEYILEDLAKKRAIQYDSKRGKVVWPRPISITKGMRNVSLFEFPEPPEEGASEVIDEEVALEEAKDSLETLAEIFPPES